MGGASRPSGDDVVSPGPVVTTRRRDRGTNQDPLSGRIDGSARDGCRDCRDGAADQRRTGFAGRHDDALDGKQLPPPPPKFGGKIERNAAQSKPYWPPRVEPPKGAPNVLLIMTDDAGFGVPSTFGGVIPTPTLDRIAANGLRYTNFHSTALCSPTRAALITGRNHHSSGFGVISEQATGYPGYDSIITRDKATIGRILKDNGYRTSWFGKDHNTPAGRPRPGTGSGREPRDVHDLELHAVAGWHFRRVSEGDART